MALVNQPSRLPTRKLTIATGGGLFGVPIISWLANDIFGLGMPELVAAEIAVGIAFIAAWFVRDRSA